MRLTWTVLFGKKVWQAHGYTKIASVNQLCKN